MKIFDQVPGGTTGLAGTWEEVEGMGGEFQGIIELDEGPLSLGQRAADWVTSNVGSWKFVLLQTVIVVLWAILNITAYVRPWDPYPFIFMNLVFSIQAAYTASLVMISQNRQDEMARIMAHNNYVVDLRTAREVRAIHDHLDAQDRALAELRRISKPEA